MLRHIQVLQSRRRQWCWRADTQTRDSHAHDRNTTGPQEQIQEFEAALKDIDDAINTDFGFLISNTHSLDPSLAVIGIDHHVGINGDITEDLGIQNNILETVEERLTPQISKLSPMVIKFEMGQVDKQMDCKNGKGGPKKCGGKNKIN